MKKIVLILFLAFVFCGFQNIEIKPIEIGALIPKSDFKMYDVFSAKDMAIVDLKGDFGTLVIFSCNTCPYVVANEQRISNLQQLALRMNIGVVFINSNEARRDSDDSKENMKTYGKNKKFIFPYLVDINSELANAFGATRTPEIFLFDNTAKLVYRGAIDDSPKDEKQVKIAYLLDAMTALSKGKEIVSKTTVSSGCSIKRKQ